MISRFINFQTYYAGEHSIDKSGNTSTFHQNCFTRKPQSKIFLPFQTTNCLLAHFSNSVKIKRQQTTSRLHEKKKKTEKEKGWMKHKKADIDILTRDWTHQIRNRSKMESHHHFKYKTKKAFRLQEKTISRSLHLKVKRDVVMWLVGLQTMVFISYEANIHKLPTFNHGES